MKIGQKIKQRRLELGWSQRDLATRMNYDHSTVGRIERGAVDIPQSRIVQFSKVLGVPISYLMDWEDEMNVQPVQMAERHVEMIMDEDLNDLFEVYRQLDTKKKKMLRDIAHSWVDTEA